jgi:hypothetical protein
MQRDMPLRTCTRPGLLGPIVAFALLLAACEPGAAREAPSSTRGAATAAPSASAATPVPVPTPGPTPGPTPTPLAAPTLASMPLLAKSGERCVPCIFDEACRVRGAESTGTHCCSYTGDDTAGSWRGSGRAARCLAMMLGAPHAPAKGIGKLMPLATAGATCTQCQFTPKCFLSLGSADAPCCDYTGGTIAEQWPESPDGARCLAEITGK